jgi:DNA-binding NtrC family response regulator
VLKILVSLESRESVQAMLLSLRKHEVKTVYDKAPVSFMKKRTYDLVVFEGDLESVAAVKQSDPRVEVIFIGKTDEEAVEAIENGASAFFSSPVDIGKFQKTINSIDELFNKKRETARLEKLLNTKYTFSGVVGKNPQMLVIFNFLRRIAPYYKIVTVTGETGTGKEIIAKTLHMLSPTCEGPFIVCNCGGLVENLIESELFGHRKGSFTGAISDKKGLFEAASGGTIFLDEIGDLPLSFQSHLLRVLQDGEYRPVGSNQTLKTDCRVIAATNKDLSIETQNGNFREDLFYRVTPLTIHMPPLRDRKDEIPLLSRYFLDNFVKRTGKQVNGISMPAQAALMSHNWPGNVRELQSTIEEAAIMTSESFVRVSDLPGHFRETGKKPTNEIASLDELIVKHLRDVLTLYKGNRTRAAKALGLSRRALQRKLDKYAIE